MSKHSTEKSTTVVRKSKTENRKEATMKATTKETEVIRHELVEKYGMDQEEIASWPKEALNVILDAKEKEAKAQAEARRAKAGGKKQKEPVPTKRAKALAKLLNSERDGKVHQLADYLLDNPGDAKPVNGSNPDWYGMKCLLIALWQRGELDKFGAVATNIEMVLRETE